MNKFYDKRHCSVKDGTDYSCFTESQIKSLARRINKLSKKNKDIEKIKIGKRKALNIYDDIERVIKKNSSCDKEACILSLADISSGKDIDEIKEQIKVEQPEEWKRDVKDNRWVSNWEIDDILYREHDDNDDFYYCGAVPIDFDKCSVSNELCKFSLKKHLNSGNNKIGIVFNTGDSKGNGQHWISMFLDIVGLNGREPCIYYFDSYGKRPVDKVQELIDKILKQASRINIPMEVKHNPNRFQVSGYECGMYAIHFIKEMIKGKTFEDILRSGIMNDNTMIKLRDADMGGYLLGHHVMKGGRLTKKKKRPGKKMKGGKIDDRVNRKSSLKKKSKSKMKMKRKMKVKTLKFKSGN